MDIADTVRSTLERIRPTLSDQVRNLRFEIGTDSTGDEAIWVWIEMPDEAPEAVWAWESRQGMRDAIRSAFKAAGLEPWVYVRFAESDELARAS